MQSRYYDPAIGRFLNADGYASTGQGILGCNMFAYCGNSPVNCFDYNGKDAIWINEGDSAGPFGHSGLIIQDENGQWYYFYWGPATSSLDIINTIKVVSGSDVNHGSYLIPIDLTEFDLEKPFEENVVYLQTAVQNALDIAKIVDEDRSQNLSSFFYFHGDFQKSYLAADLAKDSKEKYNLYTNNCLQKVLFLLSQSYPLFASIGLGHSNLSTLIPNYGYVVMKEELRGYKYN